MVQAVLYDGKLNVAEFGAVNKFVAWNNYCGKMRWVCEYKTVIEIKCCFWLCRFLFRLWNIDNRIYATTKIVLMCLNRQLKRLMKKWKFIFQILHAFTDVHLNICGSLLCAVKQHHRSPLNGHFSYLLK